MNTLKSSFVEVDCEPLHKEEIKNDLIRVYRAVLEPGKGTEFHRHSKDTIYVVLEGGKISTQKMKGTPSCPTILAKGVTISKKLALVFEKIFSKYLSLDKGFIFYMANKEYPVIHRATTSTGNCEDMDLLGIEILFSNKGRFTLSNSYGRREIETEEVIISRLNLKPGQLLPDLSVEEISLFIVISGEIELIGKDPLISLSAREYYWADGKTIEAVKNKVSIDSEILMISIKLTS